MLRREDVLNRKLAVSDEKLTHLLFNELTIAKEMLKVIDSSFRIMDTAIDIEQFKKNHEILENYKKNFLALRQELLNYISKISPSLYNREDWIRIASYITGIVDKISGIAYRIDYFASKNWSITEPVREKFLTQIMAVSDIIDKYMTLLPLTLRDPRASLSKIQNIKQLEAYADEKYREATFTILESNISLPSLVLLLKISEMLEEIADSIDSAADSLYIVLLSL